MPYRFGEKSRREYATLDPELQILCDEVLKYYDCSVLCGHRNEEDQTLAFNAGVSRVRFPGSKHNKLPSIAVDLSYYIPGVSLYNQEQSLVFAGIVLATASRLFREGRMTREVRWGGDWNRNGSVVDNRFNDLVHFELV